MTVRTIGVLGMGSIGSRHAGNLKMLGQQVLSYDPKKDKKDHRAWVIKNSDAVVIATPNVQHRKDLVDCLAAKKPIFAEKPIFTGNVPDDLAQAILKASPQVIVGYNLRFCEIIKQAKAVITAGGIGKPIWASVTCTQYMPDWVPSVDYRKRYSSHKKHGGCIYDISHEIDLDRHLLGHAVVTFVEAGTTGLLEIECEDFATFGLIHTSNCRSVVVLDYLTKPPIRATTIVGTEGQLTIDLLARWSCLTGRDGQKQVFQAQDTFDKNYIEEMQAFLAHLDGHETISAKGEDGLAVLDICLQVRKKAELPI